MSHIVLRSPNGSIAIPTTFGDRDYWLVVHVERDDIRHRLWPGKRLRDGEADGWESLTSNGTGEDGS